MKALQIREHNLRFLSKLFKLSATEQEIFRFSYYLHVDNEVANLFKSIQHQNINNSYFFISHFLELSIEEVRKALSPDSRLRKIRLLTSFSLSTFFLYDLLKWGDLCDINTFSRVHISSYDLLAPYHYPEFTSSNWKKLGLTHQSKRKIINLVKSAVKNHKENINILIYSNSWGKNSDLICSLTKKLKLNTYLLPYFNEKIRDDKTRLEEYIFLQELVKHQENLIVIFDGITPTTFDEDYLLNQIPKGNYRPTTWVVDDVKNINNVKSKFTMILRL